MQERISSDLSQQARLAGDRHQEILPMVGKVLDAPLTPDGRSID
jgi:hypothetical protein